MNPSPLNADPETVVRAAALAMHEERWHDVAALCDDEALQSYRERLRRNLQHARDAAALQARYGVQGAEELEALAPAELLARQLATNAPRAQIRRQLGPHADLEVFDEVLRYPIVEVLGHVRERIYGREVAHVLTRYGEPHGPRDPHAPIADDAPVDLELVVYMPPTVTAVVRGGDGTWAIAPHENLLGLGGWSISVSRNGGDWEGELPDP